MSNPSTARNDEIIAQVQVIIHADRHQSVVDVAGICMTMQHVCQHLVHKNLSPEERMLLSGNNIATVDADPTLLDRLITGDETWCYLYDPQS
ncbi:hypothetical protein J437_LFUL018135 [Ladona fulva]|uniref:Uncharacterized protein n=1 Tax=Ladona fulva TaxID=123851 RepID=A0A8K0NTE7_LADFU|nr:hypothetical protein J437_LFUL018135 [Ladona fulva]